MSTKNVKAGLSKANVNAIAGAIGTATLNRLVPIFSTSVAYEKGQYTNYNNQLYRFTANKAAGAWDSTKVESASLNDLINDVNAAVESVTGKANVVDLETGALIPAKAQIAQGLATTLGKLDKTPFAYMSSGGKTDIETGLQRTLKLSGVNVVKNQYFAKTTYSATNNGITYGWNKDTRHLSIQGTATAQAGNDILAGSKKIPSGHIVLFFFSNYQNNGSQINLFLNSAYNVYIQLKATGNPSCIKTLGSNLINVFGYQTSQVFDLETDYIIVDLTQRYGSNDVVNAIIGTDTDEEKIARLLQFDPNILKDTDYDEGSMVTVKTAFLKSDGYNVWDEEVEVGGISTTDGSNVTNGNYYRSKNYTRVKSGVDYYILAKDVNDLIYAFEYDINKNLIKYINFRGSSRTTLQQNTAYLRICNTARNTYQNNVSIFEYWDGSRIGYEKHEEKIEPMPNVELHGILKVDESGNVYADGDELYADHTNNKKRYDILNLSNINGWGTPNSVGWVSSWNLPSSLHVKTPSSSSIAPNAISNKLQVTSPNHTYSNDYEMSISGNTTQQNITLRLPELIGKNTSEAKTYIDSLNIILIYELDEEQELETNDFNENLWADDFGHLQCLDEDGNEIVGLQGVEILYRANVAGFAESLYDRAGGEPSNVVIESERAADNLERDTVDAQLKEALGGTLRQLLASNNNITFNETDFVDMGELNWAYWEGSIFVDIPQIKVGVSVDRIICTKYQNRPYNTELDKSIQVSYNGYRVVVTDSSYTSATAFKEAMKGVLLAYEKASS